MKLGTGGQLFARVFVPPRFSSSCSPLLPYSAADSRRPGTADLAALKLRSPPLQLLLLPEQVIVPRELLLLTLTISARLRFHEHTVRDTQSPPVCPVTKGDCVHCLAIWPRPHTWVAAEEWV